MWKLRLIIISRRSTYSFAKKTTKSQRTQSNIMKLMDESSMKIHPVIGLEIHAQLDCKSKLFSPASTYSIDAPSNTCVDNFVLFSIIQVISIIYTQTLKVMKKQSGKRTLGILKFFVKGVNKNDILYGLSVHKKMGTHRITG